MCKAASTLTADIWPLACVYPHVLPQVCGLSERFATHRAGVRLETKVDIFVSPQTARVLEGLGASVTGVWTLSSVLAQVVLIVRTPFKSQWAIGAHKCTQACMDTLMDLGTEEIVACTFLSFVSIAFFLFPKWVDSSPGEEMNV